MDWSSAECDCIAELCDALSEDLAGKALSLHGRTICFSLRSFARIPPRFACVSMWPRRDKASDSSKWPRFRLEPCALPATVCSVSGAGTKLSDGTLEMLEHACTAKTSRSSP
jgi:hypothetical protein